MIFFEGKKRKKKKKREKKREKKRKGKGKRNTEYGKIRQPSSKREKGEGIWKVTSTTKFQKWTQHLEKEEEEKKEKKKGHSNYGSCVCDTERKRQGQQKQRSCR